MSDAHVVWSVAGAACELVGLLLLYTVVRGRQRTADVQGFTRTALERAAGAWQRARDEIKRTIENPAPPMTHTAELRGSAAAHSSSSGVLTVGGVADEPELEAARRRIAKLEVTVRDQADGLAAMQRDVRERLATTQDAIDAVRDQFQAELDERDEAHKRGERTATRLEVFGSTLFVIGVFANLVANLT
jgi:hypothetical protein